MLALAHGKVMVVGGRTLNIIGLGKRNMREQQIGSFTLYTFDIREYKREMWRRRHDIVETTTLWSMLLLLACSLPLLIGIGS